MALRRFAIGDLVEQVFEVNDHGEFGPESVMGMTISKEIIPTKANVNETDLSKFIVVRPSDFIFNPRTHGKHIGFGFNDSDSSFLISWNNIAFRITRFGSTIVDPKYLFLHFNRDEWDREACYRSWGSSTEVFSWEALCEMQLNLPDIDTQRKYVAIYRAMLENQRCYEQGLDDLKLACDTQIDELRRSLPHERLDQYISRIDKRNTDNSIKNVKGVSTSKIFRDPTSKVDRENLQNYKIVRPRQFSFVQTTHNEKVFAYALNLTQEDIVVTSVNEVFEVDENRLLPEYLALFFSRPEFDRYARYHSWGSARETFTWQDLIEVKIPIADMYVQQSIADLYTVWMTRQEINQRLKRQLKDLCPILIKGSVEDASE